MDMLICLSNGNGPALPIEVDKAPPEKNGSEKKYHTIKAHPPHLQDIQ